MAHLSNPKRRREFNDSNSEDEIRERAVAAGLDAWPRFLILEGETEQSLKNLSPFLVDKWFQGICSTGFKSIQRQRSGAFLVECSTKRASDLLLKRNDTLLHDRKVRVSTHARLNSCRGVVRCADLKDCTEVEIREGLADQGVTAVQRITITKEARKVPTNTLILTFANRQLPESIKVGYLKVRVTPYIPSPLRCFKCQRFGHISKFCKNKEMCSLCAQERHDGECKGPKLCVNCGGSHPSNSKDCPSLAREREIQRVKVVEKCSFVEAKKKVNEKMPSQQTYAKVSAGSSSPDPPKAKLESMLEKVVQSLNIMSENLNLVMQAMNLRMQTGAHSVTPSSTPPAKDSDTQKSTPSSGQGVSQSSTASSGRRTTESTSPPNKDSKGHKSVKPPTGPKPRIHTKPGQTKHSTSNIFSVLQEMDTELNEETLPSSSPSSRATSPKKKQKQ